MISIQPSDGIRVRQLCLFWHFVRAESSTDYPHMLRCLTYSPLKDWKHPSGRPRTMWLWTVQFSLWTLVCFVPGDELGTIARGSRLWRKVCFNVWLVHMIMLNILLIGVGKRQSSQILCTSYLLLMLGRPEVRNCLQKWMLALSTEVFCV